MSALQNYMRDGMHYQARAVLCHLQGIYGEGLEISWDTVTKEYKSEISVSQWINGREKGYVVTLNLPDAEQLHIAWFEHRNSDSIHAIMWKQRMEINPPTIATAIFNKIYRDKFDTSHSVQPYAYAEMASWILEQLTAEYMKCA